MNCHHRADEAVATADQTAPGPPHPRLLYARRPRDPRAVVLVLHGGGGDGSQPVGLLQPSVLRTVPLARWIARTNRHVAVLRLINATRGFGNDPLRDIHWALRRIQQRFAGPPVCLVGHSLGGSVALASAGHAGVVSVVALAPWLSGDEHVRQLRGRHTLIVHGQHDSVTSAPASERYATQARSVGAAVSVISVRHGDHAMLRRFPVFDRLAADYAALSLPIDSEPGRRWRPNRSRAAYLVARALTTPGSYVL